MKQSWTKGLDKKAALEMRGEYLAARLALKRLVLLLEEKQATAIKNGRSKEGYDCPNWASKQADLIGYTRAIDDIIDLIGN